MGGQQEGKSTAGSTTKLVSAQLLNKSIGA